jgi:methylmalonyl-CoA mutase N-terminal domain/subunit
VTKVVDPLGRFLLRRALTHEISPRAWELIEEVEEMGGMTKAVESGMPKLRIEEAAARAGAHRPGEEVIVGVNKYRLEREEIDILDIDNDAVREAQIARLEKIRAERATRPPVDGGLARSPPAPKAARATCSTLAVEAARARATVGEIRRDGGGVRPPPRRGEARSPGSMARPTRATRTPRSRSDVEASPRWRAAGRACWSSRWARTATTGAPR